MMSIMPCTIPNLVIVEATGTVTEHDYHTVLQPQLQAQTGHINLVYILDTDREHYTAQAIWADTVGSFKNLFRWHRIALVHADDHLSTATDLLIRLLPGELKVFARHDLEAAIEWAAR